MATVSSPHRCSAACTTSIVLSRWPHEPLETSIVFAEHNGFESTNGRYTLPARGRARGAEGGVMCGSREFVSNRSAVFALFNPLNFGLVGQLRTGRRFLDVSRSSGGPGNYTACNKRHSSHGS